MTALASLAIVIGMNIIEKLTGKTFAGYAIMTRAYKGQEFQSGPTYATRKEAAKAFAERRFQNDPTARIAMIWN